MENIEKIVFINLEKKKDRLDDIQKQFETFNFPKDKIIRFNAIENLSCGIGCSKSHMEVIRMAKENGWKNVLVLEDDFEIVVSEEEFKKNLQYFFERMNTQRAAVNNNNDHWDVAMLAYNTNEPSHRCEPCFFKTSSGKEEEEDSKIGKIVFAVTASAYIVNGHYLETLLRNFEESVIKLEETGEHWHYAVDVFWKTLQAKDNWYYFKQRLSMQKRSYDENKNYNC